MYDIKINQRIFLFLTRSEGEREKKELSSYLTRQLTHFRSINILNTQILSRAGEGKKGRKRENRIDPTNLHQEDRAIMNVHPVERTPGTKRNDIPRTR